jgi:hypothetical protein
MTPQALAGVVVARTRRGSYHVEVAGGRRLTVDAARLAVGEHVTLLVEHTQHGPVVRDTKRERRPHPAVDRALQRWYIERLLGPL